MGKEQKIMRPGNTAKDKRTGAWTNRFENRAARGMRLVQTSEVKE